MSNSDLRLEAKRNSIMGIDNKYTLKIDKKRNTTKTYNKSLKVNDRFDLDFLAKLDIGSYNMLDEKIKILCCLAYQRYLRNILFCTSKYKSTKMGTPNFNIMDVPEIKKIFDCVQKNVNNFSFCNVVNNSFVLISESKGHYYHLKKGLSISFLQQYYDLEDFLKANHTTLDNVLFNPCVSLILE